MFLFTDRESYLAYRREWKSDYRDLSRRIRALKSTIASTMRSDGYAGLEQAEVLLAGGRAYGMLAELMEAKAEAGRQWAAARAEAVS